MSYCNIDFAPKPLDVFDGRRAAEQQARTVCEQLICDDESSMVSDEARLVAALYLVAGSLATRLTQAERAAIFDNLVEQVVQYGIVVQHGRLMSLD